MRPTISYRMFDTLKKGKERLGREALVRMTAFVESQRLPDESFRNKSGQPDLYYTMFGWVLSYILGVSQDTRKMSVYLNSQPKSEMDLIHTAAYIRCQLIHRLREKGMLHFFLHRESISHSNLISSDQYPNNDPHAPYSQFIFLSMREDGKQDVGDKDTILQTIARYRIAEGGYANRAGGPSATTNATVAALAVQGQLAGYTINADMACLQQMQDTSGGFRATTESPVPDLLSTATALFILKCYGVVPRYVTDDFIDAHWLDSGGFAATLLDDMSDVEYTFYGLLALGTL